MGRVARMGWVFLFLVGIGDASAAPRPVEVDQLIKCHEGKFTEIDAVLQLNHTLNDPRGFVVSSDSWEGDPNANLLLIRAPFRVSAPTLVRNRKSVLACVTLSKN